MSSRKSVNVKNIDPDYEFATMTLSQSGTNVAHQPYFATANAFLHLIPQATMRDELSGREG